MSIISPAKTVAVYIHFNARLDSFSYCILSSPLYLSFINKFYGGTISHDFSCTLYNLAGCIANIVPIERLHKLQTAKGPIDQIFKVAKVVVTTAGGDVTIRFLDEEKARHIAESLKERINEIVMEEREETEHERDGE